MRHTMARLKPIQGLFATQPKSPISVIGDDLWQRLKTNSHHGIILGGACLNNFQGTPQLQ
jgi:hypothetical protein